MALSRIPITPGMTPQAMAQAINQNFEQLESENRTKVFKDESGVSRILIGRTSKGKYVIAMSKEGIDVEKALEE